MMKKSVLQPLVVVLMLGLASRPSSCCSSSAGQASRPSSNEVAVDAAGVASSSISSSELPSPVLFSRIDDGTPTGKRLKAKERKYCAAAVEGATDIVECRLITVHLEAFAGDALAFPLLDDGQSVTVLKKVDAQGLDLLLADGDDLKTTAVVNYKVGPTSVSFVIKNGQVFGSLQTADRNRIFIKPCAKFSQCHLFVRKLGS